MYWDDLLIGRNKSFGMQRTDAVLTLPSEEEQENEA
jgi:hypothetical protein